MKKLLFLLLCILLVSCNKHVEYTDVAPLPNYRTALNSDTQTEMILENESIVFADVVGQYKLILATYNGRHYDIVFKEEGKNYDYVNSLAGTWIKHDDVSDIHRILFEHPRTKYSDIWSVFVNNDTGSVYIKTKSKDHKVTYLTDDYDKTSYNGVYEEYKDENRPTKELFKTVFNIECNRFLE